MGRSFPVYENEFLVARKEKPLEASRVRVFTTGNGFCPFSRMNDDAAAAAAAALDLEDAPVSLPADAEAAAALRIDVSRDKQGDDRQG